MGLLGGRCNSNHPYCHHHHLKGFPCTRRKTSFCNLFYVIKKVVVIKHYLVRSHGMPFIQESPLDPKPPWGTLTKFQALIILLIHQAWHVPPSPNPYILMDVSNGPPRLNPLDTKIIQWHIPKDGICLLKLFKGIDFGLMQFYSLASKFVNIIMGKGFYKPDILPCVLS